MSWHHTDAARLRNAGKLWPENLTQEELQQELGAITHDTGPITRRMLQEEWDRRLRILREQVTP